MAQDLGGFRERHRLRRRREFVETALRIVSTDGLPGLTMLRVTEELNCAAGSIYHYFPSKGALVAEVQREALSVLGLSMAACQEALDARLLAERASERLAALARVVVAARFWVAAEDVYPQEITLCMRLFTEPEPVLADDEAEALLPPAWALLFTGKQLFDDAAAAGALTPGDGVERAVLVLAGATGVLLTTSLSRWDESLFDGRHLAGALVTHLFSSFGATPEDLAEVDRHVAALAGSRQLVPLIEHDFKS